MAQIFIKPTIIWETATIPESSEKEPKIVFAP